MIQDSKKNDLLRERVAGYLNKLIKPEIITIDAHTDLKSAQKNLFQKIAERMIVHQKSIP